MTSRTSSPPPVVLQERDRVFLKALYDCDGVLSYTQTRAHFYPGIADSTFDNRLRQLKHNQYIHYPTTEQKREHPVPDRTVYWLGVKGIAEVAAHYGVDADFPNTLSNDALNKYARRLRMQNIRWVREPHWRYLKHHLAVCDGRFLARAAAKKAALIWQGWTAESVFRADRSLQTVTYTVQEVRRGGQIVDVE
ncbi:MAG: hypothetical protein IIA17_07915, partial [candidate division Zixibacteria bacterium]|nr:hypothetical protein [candidate division Zixibacteria bacterium]